MKYLLSLTLLLIGPVSMAQDLFDLEGNSKCELFSDKKDFDRNKRLQQIKNIEGQLVTIYLVKGKTNKIISSYTGKVDVSLIKQGLAELKTLTSVLVVTEDKGNGQMVSHLPLTDDKSFRIYLTECLKK